MTLIDKFVVAFGIWEQARPYLYLMFDEQEMRLIVALQDKAVTEQEVAQLLGLPHEQADSLLRRCYTRCIVEREEKDGSTTYTAGSFDHHLDYFAKYENWDEIPRDDRVAIDCRFLDEFIDRHRPNIERLLNGQELEPEESLPNDAVLLLGEVEEMLQAATHIIVQPCDCRRLGQNCDRPVETCIWLDDLALEALDRGHGRSITREEAIELVRWADKKGLMHTADAQWRTRGLHAICNCCACDCYPFRAAQELGSKGLWPQSRYVAVYEAERCNLCGACVKRCHFDAFIHEGTVIEIEGKKRQNVLYRPERCWGCGLCANTCPSDAILMEPWP